MASMRYYIINGEHEHSRAIIITGFKDGDLTLEERLKEALPVLIDNWIAAYRKGADDERASHDELIY